MNTKTKNENELNLILPTGSVGWGPEGGGGRGSRSKKDAKF